MHPNQPPPDTATLRGLIDTRLRALVILARATDLANLVDELELVVELHDNEGHAAAAAAAAVLVDVYGFAVSTANQLELLAARRKLSPAHEIARLASAAFELIVSKNAAELDKLAADALAVEAGKGGS